MSDIAEVFNYFKEVLNVPDYYTYSYPKTELQQTYNVEYDFELYAHIGDIKVYLISPEFSLFNRDIFNSRLNHNTTINSRLILVNDSVKYELLTPINGFTILVINDIIKYFKGVLL